MSLETIEDEEDAYWAEVARLNREAEEKQYYKFHLKNPAILEGDVVLRVEDRLLYRIVGISNTKTGFFVARSIHGYKDWKGPAAEVREGVDFVLRERGGKHVSSRNRQS